MQLINFLNRIIFCQHPKDNSKIYDFLERYKKVVFDLNISPLPSLNIANTSIGAENYLLYMAHGCGFKVYTNLAKNIRDPRSQCYVYKKFGK